MSRRARKIRQAIKNAVKAKKKIEKKARYKAAQDSHFQKKEKSQLKKVRVHRIPKRNRRTTSDDGRTKGTVSFKVFSRLTGV